MSCIFKWMLKHIKLPGCFVYKCTSANDCFGWVFYTFTCRQPDLLQKLENLRLCHLVCFRSGEKNNLFRDGEKTVLLENNLKLTGHTIPLVEKHLAKARITWTSSNQSVLMSYRLCRMDIVRNHFKAHVWPARKRFHFFIGSGRRLW